MGLLLEEKVLWDSQSLAANKDSDAVDTRYFGSAGVLLVWAGASATDAAVKLQFSFDKTNWYDISGMTKTIGAASGSQLFELTRDKLSFPWIRASLSKGSETTGTATVRYILKGL
jgi:ABC-type branched-subunit amino acid transport system permease subunit